MGDILLYTHLEWGDVLMYNKPHYLIMIVSSRIKSLHYSCSLYITEHYEILNVRVYDKIMK